MTNQIRPSEKEICDQGGDLGFSIDNAVILAVGARHGHEVTEEIQFNVLRSHQKHLFLGGLKKLGLDKEESDPVRCAKFHVLSNHLGGLRVRYGEGDGKAWVVYDTPYWLDSPWSPGISQVATRPELMYQTMGAWHGNNGVALGNPRLVYVQNQLVAWGDACDAGYFYEEDHDVAPEERMQHRPEEGLPADLKLVPADLDETVWPIERQAKAWRNFSVAYVGGRMYWLKKILGEEKAVEIFEYCVRVVMLQKRERIQALFGIEGEPSPQRAAALFCAWHECLGDEIDITNHGDGSIECIVKRSRFHEVGEFAAPADPVPAPFEEAINRSWSTVISYDCPGVEVVASGSMLADTPAWTFVIRNAA